MLCCSFFFFQFPKEMRLIRSCFTLPGDLWICWSILSKNDKGTEVPKGIKFLQFGENWQPGWEEMDSCSPVPPPNERLQDRHIHHSASQNSPGAAQSSHKATAIQAACLGTAADGPTFFFIFPQKKLKSRSWFCLWFLLPFTFLPPSKSPSKSWHKQDIPQKPFQL